MEMIQQGWPLYAGLAGTGRVFAIVGWERTAPGVGASPIGVEIDPPRTALPYAMDLRSAGPDLIISPSLNDARFAASPARVKA